VVVAEFAASVTSLRAALDIAKAMIGLRDAEAFRSKSIELQETILKAMNEAIESREAYAAQIDRIRALEAEVANLKAWGAEKERYELKSVGQGCVAYVLKPEARGTEAPHWLCPNCFAKGEKAFLQATGATNYRDRVYKCARCEGIISSEKPVIEWPT